MGSLISLELINIELQFISEPDNYNWLNWNLLAIVLPIFAIILILIICLFKQHHPTRNTQRWTPRRLCSSQQAETTDSTMECDPTPTIGIATTESSAPPTTETTPTHPRVQPPSPPAATHETTDDEPAAVDIPLPDGPPPLAALKLPQRFNIASRVRILESGTIEALPINEHTIKKNMIRKWERTKNKRIHKRITISKPTPLNKVHINPTYIHNLLTPPPPPSSCLI
uniref:Uncharacterized protein n=1 Tax=Meloidogyne enterolobii TaxID=390850 RepID=A0A6V7VLR0_MELEN|nr:unnamed protein product [Meloidogyne enterolobii]